MTSRNSPRRMLAYRGLIMHLAQRELKAKHKKSLLGWLWSLINPAATLGIYTLVFGYFLKIPPPRSLSGTVQNFAVYLFAALVTWNFFSSVLNGSMLAFQTSGGMLTKVYFPPECPALANLVVAAVQFAIELAILMAILIGFGNVSWTFLWAPVIFVQLALFAIGCGLVVSLWNIRYRDVSYLIGIALQMLFYCTPIVYRLDIVPERIGALPAREMLEFNPLTQFVGNMRACLYDLNSPPLGSLAIMSLVSVVAAVGGWVVFARSAPSVIEEL